MLKFKILSSLIKFSILGSIEFFDPSTLIAVIDPSCFRSFNLNVSSKLVLQPVISSSFGKKTAPDISLEEEMDKSKKCRETACYHKMNLKCPT